MRARVFRYLAGSVALGVVLTMAAGPAAARPMKFDLRCHYVKVFGHESYGGIQIPYRGPRVRTMHTAVDLAGMTVRWLHPGLVAVPARIPRVSSTKIWLEDTPYLKTIIDRSDGRFVRLTVENDNSRMVYRGGCRFDPFTPPDPPGQAYRGW
jgi:hypothetical protein